MRRRFLGALGLAVFLSAPAAAADGGKQGAWELGAYGGQGFLLDDYGTDHLKDSGLVGGRIAYWLVASISLEPSYQWLFTKTDRALRANDGASIQSFRFDLLYHFLPGKPFRPFLALGPGWERTVVGQSYTSDDLGVNAGLGFHWFFTDWLALRVDGRYIYTEIDKLASERQHNVEATGGVSFFFGGRPPADAVRAPEKPIDSDHDGVPDGIDQCPDTPAGTEVDEKGCPVIVDSDGDGVPDPADKCPDTPRGTKVDEMGCPLVTKSRGVLQGVVFEFGKAALTSGSQEVLEFVAQELAEFPDVKVEVQGHTDDIGPDAANVKLSQARAQSVVDYLVSQGIERDRLVANGYGPSVPITDNKTPAGRLMNRRVELKWLEK
ncbi:MAG: OmpA family protein [Elusimicrobia bacterium]|nr:OmpA family protein [Elusimicrobiota bacterium]